MKLECELSLLIEPPTDREINDLMKDLFDHWSLGDLVWGSHRLDVFFQPNVYFFGERIENRLVSVTTLYQVRLFSRHLGVIEEVVTLKEYRNRGISTRLVKEAIDYAKARGCTCVELTVREDRPEIQEFYKRLGFFDRNNRAMRINL
jgi:ribosomal protein S18 acetylase RimI-like enzyme